MSKLYLDIDVYQAFLSRMDYVFEHFDNIYVGFSGGKDSGLLWHLLLRYMDERGIKRRIGLFHQDFEAQFSATSEFVERVFTRAPDFADRFWCCIPQAVENSLSVYEPFWYTWDDQKRELWARPMPEHPYVYTLENNPFDFYRYRMPEEDFHAGFTAWYRDHCGGGRTIGLLGVRSDESLNRYRAVAAKIHMHGDQPWTTDLGGDCYTGYPLYDWTVEDVWIANGRFGFDYNRLYDLYNKAGVPLHAMRVASPFLSEGRAGLNAYRIIDPVMWSKLVGRVNGANFGAIYGKTKAVAYRDVKLPAGHTWKSYTKYLLSTLPDETRANYERIFETSIRFWHEKGGGMPPEVVEEARAKGLRFHLGGKSPWAKSEDIQALVIDGEIPDDTDAILSTNDLPSWKRMCMCILRNDYTCKTMGFAPTKEQLAKINAIKAKYRSVMRGGEG